MLLVKTCYRSLVIFFAIFLIASCEKEETKNQNLAENNAVLERIKELGFDLNDVVEYDDYYVVEGDITFLKKEPKTIITDSTSTLKQARTNNLAFNGTVRIFLNENFPTLNDEIRAALDDVITAYNNLNSALTFQRVTNASQAHITVLMDDGIRWDPYCGCEREVCGRGGFPFSNGNPFNTVSISERTLTINGITNHGQLVLLLAHELGHNIGLRHTNWAARGEDANPDGAIYIPNTPVTDNASYMNAANCGYWWAGFSTYDIVAITNLYPNYTWNSFQTPGTGALSSSDIAVRMKPDNDKDIFYINSQGYISVAYCLEGSWSSYVLSSFPKAKTTCGIEWNDDLKEFYYVGSSNSTIYRVYINSNWGWSYAITPGVNASSNSDIAIRAKSNGDKDIFYVNSQGYISVAYLLNGSWSSYVLNKFPKAKTTTGLIWNQANEELYYVANNNTICRIFVNYADYSWSYEYTAGTSAASNSQIGVRVKSNGNRDVFYRANTGVMCVTYNGSDGTWGSFPMPSNYPLVKSGSSIIVNDTSTDVDDVYYIGTDNKIYDLYVNDQFWTWDYRAISRKSDQMATYKMAYANNALNYINGSVVYQMTFNR